MFKRFTQVVAVLAIVGLAVSAQATTIYSTDDSFSDTSNPNGVWSYGVGLTGFTLFDALYTPTTDTHVWGDSVVGGDPGISYNSSGSAISQWLGVWNSRKVVVSTAGSAAPIVVRWTAPGAGTVDVGASFMTNQYFSWDPGRYNNIAVYHNGTSLWSSATAGYLVPVAMPAANGSGLTVALGDTIQFVTTPTSDTTGICSQVDGLVTFTVIPEPATLVLLATGLLGLLCYAWRKRK